MVSKYFSGRIPRPSQEQSSDKDLREIASGSPAQIDGDLGMLAFNRYLQDIWVLVMRANRYVEENAPWTLAKKKDFDRLGSVLYNLAESLRLIAVYLYPVMPSKAQKIWDGLGIRKQISACRFQEEQVWGLLNPDTTVYPEDQLFRRIETGTERETPKEKKMEKTDEQALTPVPAPAALEPIGIEDFMKADLRVGKIVSAERVKKSEKLVKLQVDIGPEIRQVVAGIGKSYSPEELTGKTVVVVANLKPAKLMGVESQGMLLAASSGDLLAVVTFDRAVKPGSRVK
jgi:methionyl-tRNA synthetase